MRGVGAEVGSNKLESWLPEFRQFAVRRILWLIPGIFRARGSKYPLQADRPRVGRMLQLGRNFRHWLSHFSTSRLAVLQIHPVYCISPPPPPPCVCSLLVGFTVCVHVSSLVGCSSSRTAKRKGILVEVQLKQHRGHPHPAASTPTRTVAPIIGGPTHSLPFVGPPTPAQTRLRMNSFSTPCILYAHCVWFRLPFKHAVNANCPYSAGGGGGWRSAPSRKGVVAPFTRSHKRLHKCNL